VVVIVSRYIVVMLGAVGGFVSGCHMYDTTRVK